MSSFKVSTGDLHNLSSALSGLTKELTAVGQIHVDTGAAGHPRVEQALGSFVGNWSEGLQKVEANLSGFTQRLDGAAGEYEQADGHVASSFGGH